MYRPQFVSLSKKYRVISIDLRGNGASPVLTGPVETILASQAKDVVAVLDDLGLGKVHIAGISYGGIIVQRLAIDYPDRLLSATICDSFADTTPRNIVEKINLLAADQSSVLTWPASIRRFLFAPAIAWQYRRWPLARREMQAVVGSPRGTELALQREAINSINFLTDLATVRVPCLCLVGGSSRLLVSRMKQVSTAISGSVFRVIPNSFDPSNLCNQPVFEAYLTEFLARFE